MIKVFVEYRLEGRHKKIICNFVKCKFSEAQGSKKREYRPIRQFLYDFLYQINVIINISIFICCFLLVVFTMFYNFMSRCAFLLFYFFLLCLIYYVSVYYDISLILTLIISVSVIVYSYRFKLLK